MEADFREKLGAFARRSVGLASRCGNEESTKLFLVLPFLSFLGYDDRDPSEVAPEHGADFSDKYKNRVDYAILKLEEPIVAIECKSVGVELKDERGQLRSYFNAAQSVKMGILTDGLFFYVTPTVTSQISWTRTRFFRSIYVRLLRERSRNRPLRESTVFERVTLTLRISVLKRNGSSYSAPLCTT